MRRLVASVLLGSLPAVLLACGGDDANALNYHPGDSGSDVGSSDGRATGGDGAVPEGGISAYCAAYESWEIGCGNAAPYCAPPPPVDAGTHDGGGAEGGADGGLGAGDAAATDGGNAEAGAPDAGKDAGMGSGAFASVCGAYDQLILSDAFRQAEIGCFQALNCSFTTHYVCDYGAFGQHQPTPVQKKLVQDYCATCSPGDATCTQKALTYDPSLAASVPDIFIYGWEYSDAVSALIDLRCTGSMLDAGAAASCDQAFGTCAIGVVSSEPQAAAFQACTK